MYFKPLSLEEITSYVETGDGLDKAGAYGIQSIKESFVDRIEGSVDNMMGLSRKVIRKTLKKKSLEYRKSRFSLR